MRRFMRGTRVIVVGRAVAERAAAIRLDLRNRNRPVAGRVLDLIVAATAIEHGLTLVTRNLRDYQDIAGLQLLEYVARPTGLPDVRLRRHRWPRQPPGHPQRRHRDRDHRQVLDQQRAAQPPALRAEQTD